ncbi:hypothetical protein [Chromobacterium paludis]|uniref:Uncharacterized protein n=1 Tax=Chromobacterium paludis TaxID=2605945 RepID=A0A5C1DFS8_9NEIS|nr:hypothetical protein [Chromobacterium paludis]QEL55506.1 hypothetical protein FYK34_07970 [Chromobacterium paludis]
MRTSSFYVLIGIGIALAAFGMLMKQHRSDPVQTSPRATASAPVAVAGAAASAPLSTDEIFAKGREAFRKQVEADRAKRDALIAKTEGEAQQLLQLEASFTEEERIASNTPRISLATPVTRMKDAKDKLQKLTFSTCINDAKLKVLLSMEDRISSYLAFMSQREGVMYIMQDNATKWTTKAVKEIANCREFPREAGA